MPTPVPHIDPPELLQQIWASIQTGVCDRHHGFHTPVVGTIGLDGSPQVRTIVLRACDPVEQTITFHTDSRSPKLDELRRDPRLAWTLYDFGSRVQLRLQTHATIQANNDFAKSRWDASHPNSRECYRVAIGSSAPIQTPEEAARFIPDGYENFAVVVGQIRSIEYLLLHHDGHRRLRYQLSEQNPPTVQWLVP